MYIYVETMGLFPFIGRRDDAQDARRRRCGWRGRIRGGNENTGPYYSDTTKAATILTHDRRRSIIDLETSINDNEIESVSLSEHARFAAVANKKNPDRKKKKHRTRDEQTLREHGPHTRTTARRRRPDTRPRRPGYFRSQHATYRPLSRTSPRCIILVIIKFLREPPSPLNGMMSSGKGRGPAADTTDDDTCKTEIAAPADAERKLYVYCLPGKRFEIPVRPHPPAL